MARLKGVFEKVFRFIKKQFLCIYGATLLIYRVLRRFSGWIAQKSHAFAVDVGDETGILAISLMANRNLHSFERWLWLGVVIGAIFGALKLSDLQIKRYINSPTVISVDRDYRGWNGSLPAVTLCYYDHIDSFKANEFIQDHWNVSIVDDDYFYFMDFLYAAVNASAGNYADLARFAEDERFDDVNLYEVIQAIDRPFEQVLSSFDANFYVEAFPVMTERGLCYAINSPMSTILTGRDIEFEDLKPPLTCEYGKQQCYIKMDLYESTGMIDVHSPFEVSATDASVIALHKSDEITASFKVLETVASNNLRELRVEQRKCVFHDEETSQLKVYSKTLCLVRCRAVMALEMCNCVPFFYPFVEGPTCNPAGFECLLDFKWPIWALHICKCPSTCNEIEYTVQTVKKSSWGMKLNEEGAKTDVVTSSFRWDLIPPKVRMRRDVVFSFEDLLVSFGGVMALFLGLSLLSMTRLGFVLIFHLLDIITEVFVIFRDNVRVMFVHYKSRHLKVLAQECKKADASDKRKPLNYKRKFLIGIHQKLSADDNTSGIDEVTNVSADSLNDTNVTPAFEYIN